VPVLVYAVVSDETEKAVETLVRREDAESRTFVWAVARVRPRGRRGSPQAPQRSAGVQATREPPEEETVALVRRGLLEARRDLVRPALVSI
jgi:hypothetical protein